MLKVRITDTTLRDGHQSLMATRLRTADMLQITADLNKAGFHSLEVWGGATFDRDRKSVVEGKRVVLGGGPMI